MTAVVFGFYSLVLGLALPIYRWRRRLLRRGVAPASERTRGFPRREGRGVIWLHAVSVGEVLAARSLVAALDQARPDLEVLISTTTRSGLEVARRTYPDHRVFHGPYDLKGPVVRALEALSPELLILVELEVWPRLLAECRKLDIPVVVVNAKVSESSLRGYRLLLKVLPELFEGLRLIAVQNELQAARFRELGVAEGRIRVTGSIKVDNLPAIAAEEIGPKLRLELGFGAEPVLVAGSTHEGEDETLLDAAQALRSEWPNLRLVLAPRHGERVPAVAELSRRRGLEPRLRSEGPIGTEPVLIVDTIGELADFYAVADLVFLGGSLVTPGGHNLLEPAAAGRVQIVGPHHGSMADFAAELEQAGVLSIVHDGEELAREAREILGREPTERNRAASAALAVVDRHRGATDRTMKVMGELGLPRVVACEGRGASSDLADSRS